MSELPRISLSNYTYDLPEDRIAKHPLAQRDAAKLLHYDSGEISEYVFRELPNLLPPGSLLVFNDTRVIPARLLLYRETGARIELLLLQPAEPAEVSQAMQATESAQWQCMVGNKKKWREGETLYGQATLADDTSLSLAASWVDRERNVVALSWQPDGMSFAELLEALGELPLPPYLDREPTAADRQQYQTVYARHAGAVAAPTAGLHFTDRVLGSLQSRRVDLTYLTLHVGAGTFQPVKHDNALDHPMHTEQIVFTREQVQRVRDQLGDITAVGTTSLRVLESLYWFGVEVIQDTFLPPSHFFSLKPLTPYLSKATSLPTSAEALDALLKWFDRRGDPEARAETALYVIPGYTFRVVDRLVTNFHLPGTTLILLVAAFVGEDWRDIYRFALDHDFRFLSYGDSSLLVPRGS